MEWVQREQYRNQWIFEEQEEKCYEKIIIKEIIGKKFP